VARKGSPDVPETDNGAGLERLEDLLARLDHEQQDADRAYNAALTALDRALVRMPDWPHPPPPYDEAQVASINEAWTILPSAPPATDRSVKGRLRTFIWRLVGPALDRQQGFNAALVDHLNRNVAAHREAAKATATLILLVREHVEAFAHLQGHLIQYLQSITLYVDTKDRAVGGQIQVLNAALSALADDWLKRWESLASREARYQARHSALAKAYEELTDLVAIAQQSALMLKREVEKLVSTPPPHLPTAPGAPGPPVDLDAFRYVGFEDRFRGSQDEIRARLVDYLPRFAGEPDVVDLGCGRGEFLDLLRERGIRARGVDLNHAMVELSRARGLDVEQGDALGYLRGLPDDSVGGVFAAQVIEHLEPGYLVALIETAGHKLRPGGVLVLETINPACWAAFFDSYIRDLTHVRPLHPETLRYLLRTSGFRNVEIDFRSPVPDASRLHAVVPPAADAPPGLQDLVDAFNANVATLNGRMFTFRDYAAIGRK
jgi:SAM-dependent methyltransferase